MRFGNARQCIHDAFATHLTTPDRMEAGGTRYNSNNAIAHQAEAGLIIRAVLEQPYYLRATCVFLNAPNGVCTDSEIAELKRKLWSQFSQKSKIGPVDQGAIVAIFDRILINYRRRCHDPASGDQFTGKDLETLLGRTKYTETVAGYQNQLVDLLARYDNLSLQPVWAVIEEQKEKRHQEREACAG